MSGAYNNRWWKAQARRRKDVDNWQCVRCGSRHRLEVHHVTPVEQGGSSDLANLETLCRTCHIDHHRPPSFVKGRTEFQAAMRQKKFPGVIA